MSAATAFGAARKRVSELSYRTRLIAGASVAVLGVVSASAAAIALWNAEGSFSGGKAAAGDLHVSYGVGTWQQITPGVISPAGGLLSEDTTGFHSMPGDVVEVLVPITTTLQGENLNATLSVESGSGAAKDIEDGVISATYRVQDSSGATVAPEAGEAELGTAINVPGLKSSNAGTISQWTVVVTVSVLGDYRWTANSPLLDLSRWSLDGIDVTLEQVRKGDGFVTASADS